ncbi:hypothetical protein C7M84_011710, partial [Penaeus vannamei]
GLGVKWCPLGSRCQMVSLRVWVSDGVPYGLVSNGVRRVLGVNGVSQVWWQMVSVRVWCQMVSLRVWCQMVSVRVPVSNGVRRVGVKWCQSGSGCQMVWFWVSNGVSQGLVANGVSQGLVQMVSQGLGVKWCHSGFGIKWCQGLGVRWCPLGSGCQMVSLRVSVSNGVPYGLLSDGVSQGLVSNGVTQCLGVKCRLWPGIRWCQSRSGVKWSLSGSGVNGVIRVSVSNGVIKVWVSNGISQGPVSHGVAYGLVSNGVTQGLVSSFWAPPPPPLAASPTTPRTSTSYFMTCGGWQGRGMSPWQPVDACHHLLSRWAGVSTWDSPQEAWRRDLRVLDHNTTGRSFIPSLLLSFAPISPFLSFCPSLSFSSLSLFLSLRSHFSFSRSVFRYPSSLFPPFCPSLQSSPSLFLLSFSLSLGDLRRRESGNSESRHLTSAPSPPSFHPSIPSIPSIHFTLIPFYSSYSPLSPSILYRFSIESISNSFSLSSHPPLLSIILTPISPFSHHLFPIPSPHPSNPPPFTPLPPPLSLCLMEFEVRDRFHILVMNKTF